MREAKGEIIMREGASSGDAREKESELRGIPPSRRQSAGGTSWLAAITILPCLDAKGELIS